DGNPKGSRKGRRRVPSTAIGPGVALGLRRTSTVHRRPSLPGKPWSSDTLNVHIHQFQPGGAVVDAAALEQFQQQWATYGKLVDGDCLAHRQVGTLLHDTLNTVFASGFSFLDIACGDATMMRTALRGTRVRHY